METLKNESKMSLAAKKAWITIRAKKQSSQTVDLEKGQVKQEAKQEKKLVKAKTEVEVVEKATVWDKKELAELNGDEMRKLARDNGKRAEKNIKKQMMGAEARAIEVGGIIKQAKVERFNGGVSFSKAV